MNFLGAGIKAKFLPFNQGYPGKFKYYYIRTDVRGAKNAPRKVPLCMHRENYDPSIL